MQAIIFDMDGVLIDSMPLWKESLRVSMQEVDGDFSEDLWQEHRGKRLDELVQEWHETSPWRDNVNYHEVVALVLKNVLELIKSKGEMKAGVVETLDFIADKKIPLALASSSMPEVIKAVLDTFELSDFFIKWHSAENEKYGKPHPAVYMSAAESLQADITKCLVIEDSVTGMVAAKAARAKCLVVPEYEDISEKRHVKEHQFWLADLQLQSLQEFPDNWSAINNLF